MKSRLTKFMEDKILKLSVLNRQKGVLHNFYLTLLITVISIIIIITTFLFLNFKTSSINIINKYIKDNLLQISKSTDLMGENSRALEVQIFSDRDLINLLGTTEPNPQQLSIALKRLESYVLSNPFIHSIYVYNRQTDKFYTTIPSSTVKDSNGFFDSNIVDLLNNSKELDLKYPIPRKINLSNLNSSKKDSVKVYSFILNENNSNTSFSSSSIILNINEEWLHNVINSININSISDTFIINSQGLLMSSSDNFDILSNISDFSYINKIINSNKDYGYFIDTVNNEKTSILYIVSEDFPEWKFIQTIPHYIITNNLISIKFRLLALIPILLIIALLVSRFISKKMYKPVSTLQDSVKKLEAQSRKNNYTIKNEFLNSLLKNISMYNRSSLISLCKENNINFNLNSKFVVILINIDNYSEFKSKYSLSDRNILKYSIINICDEFSNKDITCNTIDIHGNTLGIIVNISHSIDKEDILLYLESYVANIQTNVNELLNISLSFVISTTAEDISMLTSLYEEVQNASAYKIFFENKSLILADSILEKESKTFNYPYKTHEFLFNNINLGNIKNVNTFYNEIINYSLDYSYSSFINTLLNLSFSIASTISDLNTKKGIIIKFNQNLFIKNLYSSENLSEINRLFLDMFENICTKINESKSNKKEKNYDELVNKVFDIMNKSYSNPNTCIQSISDEVNMSSAYLGRLFTSLTNKSITETLNDLRMNKCCDLLINTDSPISNIYEECGFNSLTYFYKVFKKTYGVTPSEYRKNLNNN